MIVSGKVVNFALFETALQAAVTRIKMDLDYQTIEAFIGAGAPRCVACEQSKTVNNYRHEQI